MDKELNFSQRVGKDDYITEKLFYLLRIKVSNKVAKEVKILYEYGIIF